ncbi:MAG TPA: hypothetical protein VGG85_16755 [Terracidiphilus sp.]|jgi:hypothetical protein
MKTLLTKSALFAGVLLGCVALLKVGAVDAASKKDAHVEFRTSDRCVACHNGLKTKAGEDISIGIQWRASIMGNSARDPYWQGSVRRESIDHPEMSATIEDECANCHMPIEHLKDKAEGHQSAVFSRLPLTAAHTGSADAADGVSCSVCHQIESAGLGTPQTYSGNVEVASVTDKMSRPEYGPFLVDPGHQRVMKSSTAGFVPFAAAHIRDSGLCGSCHTLYTTARGPGGKAIGVLPEQMPYLEWLHSDYPNKETCQSCHMPQVDEPTRVSAVYGPEREGMHRHVFVGGNILIEGMLKDHHDDLGVQALPDELTAATARTTEFLEHRAARVSIGSLEQTASGIAFEVHAENLTGHKLPTAYPSRRVWLHVTVRDQQGRAVFESGALNADGSIVGNENDADPSRFEPHYTEITKPDEVEIFEPILGDSQGHVTTGLLTAVNYLKDNRLLPSGFDKRTATHDIAVVGGAGEDKNFTDKGSTIRYVVDTSSASGPFHVEAELWYQPVGYRWAHNLAPYKAAEPQRFVSYYEAASRKSAVALAKAEATR